MSIGYVVSMKTGKRVPSNLYIQLKNGAVYKHQQELSDPQQLRLFNLIKENDRRVKLKHWIKVKDRHGKPVSQ